MHIRLSSNPVNEIKSITINGIPATFKFYDANNNIYQYDFNLTSKSPQKINITIDEYIRYEDHCASHIRCSLNLQTKMVI